MAGPFYLFIFTLLFAPLAFGTVEYWSLAILEFVVPTSLVLLYVGQYKDKRRPVQIPGILPLVLLLCWMGFQLIPLPPDLVRLLAPRIYEIYQPLFQLDKTPHWIPLTVQPEANLQELLRFSTYGLFFILTVQLLSRGTRLRKTVTIVVWLTIGVAVEAILQKLTSPHAIYWFRTAPLSTTPIGPWVYSNHFAGFMAMLFPLVLALFLYYRPGFDDRQPLRAKFVALFTMPGTNKHLLFGMGAVLTAVSILLSVSRGGIITLCLAMLFFVILYSNKIEQRKNQWAILLIIAVLLLTSWLGWDPIMEKFSHIWSNQSLNTSGRLPLLRDTMQMIRDYLFTGSGFGTYEVAFPAYRTPGGENGFFDHAHNDYAELLATGGPVGFGLAAWFIMAVIGRTATLLRQRRQKYNILVTIGTLTGLLALLLHSFVDFQFYNGATGLYFFFLCGLAISAAGTRLQYRTRPCLLPAGSAIQTMVIIPLSLTVLVGGLWYNTTSFMARRTFSPLDNIYLNRNIPQDRLQAMYNPAEKAAALNKLHGLYPFTMGNLSLLLAHPQRASAELLRAATLNPLSGRFIQQLALNSKIEPSAREQMLLLGYEYEPLVFDRLNTLINWLAASGQKKKSLAIIYKALEKEPQWASKLGGFILFHRLTREEITTMLPPLPRPWYETGKIMEQEEKLEEAIYFYLQALQQHDGAEPRAEYFYGPYRLYLREKQEDRALAILRRGIKYLPDNSSFHKLLGNYYRKQGITYRALEEYRQALLLNPKDIHLEKLLKKLESR